MPEQSGQKSRERISARKKVLFSTIFGLFCVLFIVFTELGLRMADYGIDTRPFFNPPYLQDLYVTNTNLFKKYYPRRPLTRPDTLRDMMICNSFPRVKSDTTLRGFVVGGSTAQGFPYNRNQSFGKITELALAAGGKYEKVEVLNLGLSAISSYCVRDMAGKLLPYQPDFLVVYAGHNEYYGTISTTTGGGFFTKNLYLDLNEFRLFQMLFNIQNILNPPAEYTTLMEEQFNLQRLPIRPEMDKTVADCFVKNIAAIVKEYGQRNIPVIIIEPVSNIYDMPPFSGEKDEKFKDFIQRYTALVRGNDYQALETFYKARLPQKQYDQNANVRYLDAVTRKILSGQTNPDDFKLAKELDTIPFRAKQATINALRDYCHDHSAGNANLFFIPLEDIMMRTNGAQAFGNEYFADHLHFTQKGQRFVSRVLAQKIAEIFHFSEAEKKRVESFYQSDRHIDQAIHYLPACRTDVFRVMRNLTENSPYNRMLVAYHRKDVDGLTEDKVNQRMIALIEKANSSRLDPAVLIAASYINHGMVAEGKKYLDLFLWDYPGCFRPYLIKARFESSFSKDIEATFADYKTAYLLSNKMKSIYDEIAAFLTKHDRKDLFEKIEKFGQPIE